MNELLFRAIEIATKAQDCYVQQMDSFAKLFEEPSFYKHVMDEMARAMYFNLKNE